MIDVNYIRYVIFYFLLKDKKMKVIIDSKMIENYIYENMYFEIRL